MRCVIINYYPRRINELSVRSIDSPLRRLIGEICGFMEGDLADWAADGNSAGGPSLEQRGVNVINGNLRIILDGVEGTSRKLLPTIRRYLESGPKKIELV